MLGQFSNGPLESRYLFMFVFDYTIREEVDGVQLIKLVMEFTDHIRSKH